MAAIYNQGIEDRIATFETRLRTPGDIAAWFDAQHPIAVVEVAAERPQDRDPAPVDDRDVQSYVIAFAATSAYRPRACYRGIAELSVYVDRAFRGQGAGRLALSEIMQFAEAAGFWKLLSRIFPENHASRALVASLGFREVGIYEKHGCLDGVWRDVLIVERLLPANLT